VSLAGKKKQGTNSRITWGKVSHKLTQVRALTTSSYVRPGQGKRGGVWECSHNVGKRDGGIGTAQGNCHFVNNGKTSRLERRGSGQKSGGGQREWKKGPETSQRWLYSKAGGTARNPQKRAKTRGKKAPGRSFRQVAGWGGATKPSGERVYQEKEGWLGSYWLDGGGGQTGPDLPPSLIKEDGVLQDHSAG